MSLYADYMKEREGIDTVEVDDGFATFNIDQDICYIINIYVRPEVRRSGVASEIADRVTDIAKRSGCRTLLGSIDPKTNGSTESMQGLFAYGFKLRYLDGPLIFLSKDI